MRKPYRYGVSVLLGVTCAMVLATACQGQNRSEEGSITAAEQAITVASTKVTLNYTRPSNWAAEKSVIVGRERVDVSDRATVSGAGSAIVSLGNEPLRVGQNAKVPALWSRAGVSVGEGTVVSGSVEAGVAPSFGRGVTPAGGTTVRSYAPSLTQETITVEFGQCNNSVSPEPGKTQAIAPGSWGDVTVKRDVTLQLAVGNYKFRSFNVEPGGRVEVRTDGPGVNIAVQNGFVFRGTVRYPEMAAHLSLTVAGNEVLIDAPLKATIIAPNARVAVNNRLNPFVGSIYGREVYVSPDVTVTQFVPAGGISNAGEVEAPTLAELNLPTTAGAPPSLSDSTRSASERAVSFITWVQRSTESDEGAARDAIAAGKADANVRTALVAETWNAIATKRLSRALVAMEVLTELDTSESEQMFTSLITQPAPGTGIFSEEYGKTTDDVAHEMLQAKAALGLGWRRSETSKVTLKNAALSHPSQLVRSQAIRAYVLYYGAEGQAELAAALPEAAHGSLDVLESTNVDGRPYAVREAEYFARHPEIVIEPVPSVPQDLPANQNRCLLSSEEK